MRNSDELKKTLEGVKKGAHHSFVDLCEQYKPLIESKCVRYSSALEHDEAEQLCTIALYNAALTFDVCRNKVAFGVYASICMRNAIVDEIRREKSESCIVEFDEDDIDGICASAEDELVAREGYCELTKKMRELLSVYELTVFSMYLLGKSYKEIAHSVGKSEKSVGTALERAKAKLQKIVCN